MPIARAAHGAKDPRTKFVQVPAKIFFEFFFAGRFLNSALNEKPEPNVRSDHRVVNSRQGGGGAGLCAGQDRTRVHVFQQSRYETTIPVLLLSY
jgi:hypothetical protein